MKPGPEVHYPRPMPITREGVIVVGAGVAGAVAARDLSARDIPVLIVDRKTRDEADNPRAIRSEATFPPALYSIGAEGAITNVFNVTHIHVPGQEPIRHVLPRNDDPMRNFAVSLDHQKLLQILRGRLDINSNIEFVEGVNVKSVSEHGDGVHVVFDSKVDGKQRHVVNAVVLATGAVGKEFAFPNPQRQREFDNSIVAAAYGREFDGEITLPGGDRTAIGAFGWEIGRLSYVNPVRPGKIHIVYTEYIRRKDAGKLDRPKGLAALLKELRRAGLIDAEEDPDAPTIGGFFGMQAARSRTGYKHVFAHGDRGQYIGPAGDSIGTTIRVSPGLAEIIARGGTAQEYHTLLRKTAHHTLETAGLNARLQGTRFGEGAALAIDLIQDMSPEEQIDRVQTHRIPWTRAILRSLLPGGGRERRLFWTVVKELAIEVTRPTDRPLDPNLPDTVWKEGQSPNKTS
ncbi:MAG: FAD-dependent oxidoreductase [Candidatus Levybacteria bacterium]|nr:FAD-dependent oxidoreductase [Candidatus Levybacteria bacterium]